MAYIRTSSGKYLKNTDGKLLWLDATTVRSSVTITQTSASGTITLAWSRRINFQIVDGGTVTVNLPALSGSVLLDLEANKGLPINGVEYVNYATYDKEASQTYEFSASVPHSNLTGYAGGSLRDVVIHVGVKLYQLQLNFFDVEGVVHPRWVSYFTGVAYLSGVYYYSDGTGPSSMYLYFDTLALGSQVYPSARSPERFPVEGSLVTDLGYSFTIA